MLRATRTITGAVSALLISSCARSTSIPVVDVIGSDFAFFVPDTLPAGPILFLFTRKGKVGHEVVIRRVKAGVSIESALSAAASEDDLEKHVDPDAGLLYAQVGETVDAELLVELEPRRTYLPDSSQKSEGKTHTIPGMAKGLVVRPR